MKWNKYSHVGIALLVGCLVLADATRIAEADDESLQGQAVAPAGHKELRGARGGSFYIDAALDERYSTLVGRVELLRNQIAKGETTSEAALAELNTLETDLLELRKEIEAKKVLVAPFIAFKQAASQEFELGAEQLVVITADEITIKGWEGPGVKCTLDKIILAKAKPDAKAFEEIKVEHRLGVADDLVGSAQESREKKEREFLASEDGRKLTADQLASRKKLVDEIAAGWAVYQDFQGKEINAIEVKGLTFPEGNRQLDIRIDSPEGGGSRSSQWQRYASLTVHIPKCNKVAVRGCQVAVHIQDVACSLLLTTSGSLNSDYNGEFEIRNVDGDVTIDQAPIRLISGVEGNVTFHATDEFVNRGTTHSDGSRHSYTFPTQATEIKSVSGDLRAWFLRTKLNLQGIRGRVDVRNEFGDTYFLLTDALSEHPHRILSQSGRIELAGKSKLLTSLPIHALTQCGDVRTSLPDESLESKSFSTGSERRGWTGFASPSKSGFDFELFNRPRSAWDDQERTNGIDLISNAGEVIVTETIE